MQVIEANLDAVNGVIAALNAQIATGMSWAEIGRLIDDERAKGAPLAELIASLNLAEGTATLLLDDWLAVDSDDESSESDAGSDSDTASALDGAAERSSDASMGAGASASKAEASTASNSEREGSAKSATGAKQNGKGGMQRAPRVRIQIDLSVNAYTNAKCVYNASNNVSSPVGVCA